MEIRNLTIPEIEEVYQQQITADFPEAEVKPLEAIMQAYGEGNYACLGLFEEGELSAYAYLIRKNRYYLLDYLAVSSKMRNKKRGSVMLSFLKEHLKDAEAMLLEVEDPSLTEDEGEKKLQERRIDFYLRNGILETPVRAYTFGVHYRIMEMDFAGCHEARQIREIYLALLRQMLSEERIKQNVFV